ncbi:uncharacterized protein PHALS_13710 [Plasmopara halstedii]|uniref:Uncharacterized protein n=1 Tax=Plasmopara halstedii TaxID=4781 RepID=A0A0P1ARG0_PLAHL|nr:uncharacterized protein PHALS_13710 [Plasmopara halstedii]CEG43517.1 hypothetical protein PHALS_13710 [Plasmopara halstedii]|eukprot:XP_024579886.1 hypothetical protein PHALS_13710 [Plasmopara halstedii]
MAASRSNSPIRDALLKWQRQQDQKRRERTQERSINFASSLICDSLESYRPKVMSYYDVEEDTLMTFIKERDDEDRRLRQKNGMEFYSPVRPEDYSFKNSSSGLRQHLALSRIKPPMSKRRLDTTVRKSFGNEMKTPERWRRIAMRSKGKGIEMKEWDEEDAQQAERLLEKAAEDEKDETHWKDLFHSTKVNWNLSNQRVEHQDEKRKNEKLLDEKSWNLCQGKHSGSDSNAPTLLSSSVGEHYRKEGYDDHKEECLVDENDILNGNLVTTLFHIEMSRLNMIMVVICLLIGTSGFFVEEILNGCGWIMIQSPLMISKENQLQIRNRVHRLQQNVEMFQLSTIDMDLKAQAVLLQVRHHIKQTQKDRERYRNILVDEMQEMRHHLIHVTQEEVKRERKLIQSQLQDLVKMDQEMMHNHMKADKSIETLKETMAIQVESNDVIEDTLKDQQIDLLPLDHAKTLASIQQNDDVSVSFRELPNDQNKFQSQLGEKLVLDKSQLNVESKLSAHVDEIMIKSKQSVASSISDQVKPETADDSQAKVVATGMTLDGFILLIGSILLVVCVLSRVYNVYRHKKWLEKRRKRRNQRALLRAQQRAQAMAKFKGDSDAADSCIEEVCLMTPEHDNEEFESPLSRYNVESDGLNQRQQMYHSPVPRHRNSERPWTSTPKSLNRGVTDQQSPWQRRKRHVQDRRI